MLNEPTPDKAGPEKKAKRPHPLEAMKDAPPPAPKPQKPPHEQIILHVPTVKPYLTYALIGINVLIFAIGFLLPQVNNTFLQEGANYAPDVLQRGEYLRLLTAMFLHANVAHIFFNMYALYIVGLTVETLFGHVRFAIIYFGGGLLGSVMSAVMGPFNVASIGASGGVFAVLMAELVYLYKHRKLFPAQVMARGRFLAILAVINLGIGLIDPEIDMLGHLGGVIGGTLLAWYIGPFLLLKRHEGPVADGRQHFDAYDANPLDRRYMALSLYATGVLAILLIGVFLAR